MTPPIHPNGSQITGNSERLATCGFATVMTARIFSGRWGILRGGRLRFDPSGFGRYAPPWIVADCAGMRSCTRDCGRPRHRRHDTGCRALVRGYHLDVHLERVLRARPASRHDRRLLTASRRPRSSAAAEGSRTRASRTSLMSPAVTRVMNALGGPSSVNLLLTGHSHFDHSFDTATWSALTGARIIGSMTTCLQAQAERIPADRCTAVSGGETITLGRRRHDARGPLEPQRRSRGEPGAAQCRRARRGAARPIRRPAVCGLASPRISPTAAVIARYLFTVDSAGRALQLVLPELRQRRRSPRADRRRRPELRRADRQSRRGDEGGGTRVGRPMDRHRRACRSRRSCCRCSSPRAYLPVHWDGLYGAVSSGRAEALRRCAVGGAARQDARDAREAGAIHGQVAARSLRDHADRKPGVKKALGFQ